MILGAIYHRAMVNGNLSTHDTTIGNNQINYIPF